ncbi:hypothetical protein C8Q74DRAFT_1294814 [Fomes fomentarius]|nr:hypothetical protein C8Q74DRAFT_1294814 [Fomes fomentarius]
MQKQINAFDKRIARIQSTMSLHPPAPSVPFLGILSAPRAPARTLSVPSVPPHTKGNRLLASMRQRTPSTVAAEGPSVSTRPPPQIPLPTGVTFPTFDEVPAVVQDKPGSRSGTIWKRFVTLFRRRTRSV